MQSFADVRKAQKGIHRTSPASTADGAPPDLAEAEALAFASRDCAVVIASSHATRLDDTFGGCDVKHQGCM